MADERETAGTLVCVARDKGLSVQFGLSAVPLCNWSGRPCLCWWYHFLVLSVVLALFGAFMVSRLIFTKVIVNQYSVVLKGMFSEGSLQRSSITAIERKHTGRSNFLILWGNLDEKENLTIADVFAFDKAWDDWLSTFRDLSHDKPLSLF